MRKFLILFSTITFLFSCGKDDFVNPEDVGFGQLSRGTGIWKSTGFEYYSFDSAGNETLDSTITDNNQLIFYRKSLTIGGAIVSFNAVTIEVPNQGSVTYEVWAEEERVIFHTVGSSFDEAYVYNVRKSSRKNQIWEIINSDGSGKRVLNLEYCGSCEPIYPLIGVIEPGI